MITGDDDGTFGSPVVSGDFSGDDDEDWPSPLTAQERLARAAQFWWKVSPMLAGYAALLLEEEVRDKLLGVSLDPTLSSSKWGQRHDEGSRALSQACNELQGFYAKTGQIIAARADLFPEQYTDRLASLTDRCDEMPSSLVRRVVEKELCAPLGVTFEELFAEFDDTPLGSATVAQVHRAVLTPRFSGLSSTFEGSNETTAASTTSTTGATGAKRALFRKFFSFGKRGEGGASSAGVKEEGRVVAVKVQRPSIEAKLLGDVANLKALAKQVKTFGGDLIPVDYYAVFSELEAQLADEFDFEAEAKSMDEIGNTLRRFQELEAPLVTPLAVPGLVTKRVLVMDYLAGVPLSRALEAMKARGIDPDGPEAKLFGRKLVRSLTEAFGVSILLGGFFHADPHPGNIMVLDDGSIGLIDFGQVKRINSSSRQTLAKIMLALNGKPHDRSTEGGGDAEAAAAAETAETSFSSEDVGEGGRSSLGVAPAAAAAAAAVDLKVITSLALELGVEIKEGAPLEGAAAAAMWLFDGSVNELPGGYSTNELSPNSPIKVLKSFPQDLVMVGRNTILIKGAASRLGLPNHSLALEWIPIANKLLFDPAFNPSNGNSTAMTGHADGGGGGGGGIGQRQRDRGARRAKLKKWAARRATAIGSKLPPPLRRAVASAVLKLEDLKGKRPG